MKTKIMVLFIFFIFAEMVMEIKQAGGSDIKSNLVLEHSDIGFSYACSYYKLYYNNSLIRWAHDVVTLNISNVNEVVGKFNTNPTWENWEWKTNETYITTILNCTTTCSPLNLGNGTINDKCVENCKPYTQTNWRYVWKSNTPENLNEYGDKLYQSTSKIGYTEIRFCGDFQRTETERGWEISIDHVPRFINVDYPSYTWWNSTFPYRNNITVSPPGKAGTINYPVYRNISFITGMNTGFNDLRFTNSSNNVLPFCVETNVSSKWAGIWILIDNFEASGNTTVSMYYGSGDTTSTQNCVATFPLSENFEDGSYNTTMWTTQTGTPVEANGMLKIGPGSYVRVKGAIPFSVNYSVIWRSNFSITTEDYNGWIGYPIDSDYQAVYVFGTYLLYSKSINPTSITYNGGWLANSVFGRYEIIRNNTNSNAYYHNYTLVGEIWSDIPTGNMILWFPNSGDNKNGLFIDYVFIRPYIFPDAQATVLSQESAPIIDTTSPQWLNVGTNNTSPIVLDPVLFYANWTDDIALSHWIFSWNGTGELCGDWTNDTEVVFGGGTWSNVTKTYPIGCFGKTVDYIFYANDTSNNWNNTGITVGGTESNNLTTCHYLNQAGATYYLDADIIDSNAAICMDISADNVTLDCQGYLIDSDGSFGYGLVLNRESETNTSAVIKNCNIRDWFWSGIYLSYANNNTINNNTISAQVSGIWTIVSDSNVIYDNIFDSNNYGIILNGDTNKIYNNIMVGSISADIQLAYTDSNVIYNNLFNSNNNFDFQFTNTNSFNTTRQNGDRIIYSENYNEIGGNYWTNPTGTGYSDTCLDDNKNGFCDVAYTLETDNIDYLPLGKYPPIVMPPTWSNNQTSIGYVNKYSYFNISWDDETGFSTALFNLSFGGLSNRTMNNVFGGSIYNYSVNITEVGNYTWLSYGNDTSNNQAVSDSWIFEVVSTTTTTIPISPDMTFYVLADYADGYVVGLVPMTNVSLGSKFLTFNRSAYIYFNGSCIIFQGLRNRTEVC